MRKRKHKVSFIKLRRNRVCHHFASCSQSAWSVCYFTKHGQRLPTHYRQPWRLGLPFSDVVGKPHLEIFSNPVGLSFFHPYLFASLLAKVDCFNIWREHQAGGTWKTCAFLLFSWLPSKGSFQPGLKVILSSAFQFRLPWKGIFSALLWKEMRCGVSFNYIAAFHICFSVGTVLLESRCLS